MMTIKIPFRARIHGNCDVMINCAYWQQGDNKTKQWQVLGAPNDKKRCKLRGVWGHTTPRIHARFCVHILQPRTNEMHSRQAQPSGSREQ